MNLLALLITPDRVIVSPIPEQVVVRCCLHPGSKMPFSEGFVACWEGYSLTDWKWEIAVTRGFDGRMRRELEGIILPELPEKKIRVEPLMLKPIEPTGRYCPRYSHICPEGIDVEGFLKKVTVGLRVPAEMLAPEKKKRGRPRKVVAI